ncbi:hypothetical protein [Alteromonas sp. KUL42]|uniref:hypothetical protein n=1 Tax=Alteromonas sp. KUL42 TaxID=2480797 RepID=UPI00384EDA6B
MHPKGWHNWDNLKNEGSVTFIEGNNSGPCAGTTERVYWAHSLPIACVEDISPAHVFGNWQPPNDKIKWRVRVRNSIFESTIFDSAFFELSTTVYVLKRYELKYSPTSRSLSLFEAINYP